METRIRFFLVALTVFFLSAPAAEAVPPPDFIFNVGTQVAQFFSIAVLLLSAVGGSVLSFLRDRLAGRRRAVILVSGLLAILLASAGGAWWYKGYAEHQALQRWQAASRLYQARPPLASTVHSSRFSVRASLRFPRRRLRQPTDHLPVFL